MAEVAQAPMVTTLRRLERSAGALATQSVSRMDELLPWFRSMPADRRSWVTLVAQAGVDSLVEWMRNRDVPPRLTGEVFGTAPRDLARVVSLKQTVDLIRVVVGVVESRIESLAEPGTASELREGILRYSREIAFAAAQIYASYAESRGAWDARLEALAIDSLLRGETAQTLASQAAALGWSGAGQVLVMIGAAPAQDREQVHGSVVRAGHRRGLKVLAGVHEHDLVMVLASTEDPMQHAPALAEQFGPGPVVCGPVVTSFGDVGGSAAAAQSALAVASAWPQAPRPVAAADLLPERAMAGDRLALAELTAMTVRLAEAGPVVLDTVRAYLSNGGSLEATAREVFVHPNTVRYRLRRAAQDSGIAPTTPRGAWTLQVALTLAALESGRGAEHHRRAL
ncbi:MAG: helix-turn-helix domain-containing protein [Actinomycetota bacterium]|nr:helix-turn-helix domain-containing protein [Actinomycetota bacterium]